MADENEIVEGVSKSDEDLITKSDIAGLTKAVEELNKSFEHYFSSLTTPQPQHIGGKEHSVENTMQKGEDDEDMRKSFDVMSEIESLRKSFDEVISERDAAIESLQKSIEKMEEQKIQKGGNIVVIPEQLAPNDPMMSNLQMLSGIGRVGK